MNENRTKQNNKISARDKENCIVTEELIVNKEIQRKCMRIEQTRSRIVRYCKW